MMWILLTKPLQKYVTTVCLHCSFARLKNKHIRVLGTNVATMSWLHWSPVLGIGCFLLLFFLFLFLFFCFFFENSKKELLFVTSRSYF